MSESIDDPRLRDDVLESEGLDQATVKAVGKLSEAFETVEVARGLLYQFHRMSGTADLMLGDAVEMLRDAGHGELADRIDRELLGRNVLPGRWTFQVVEAYDDDYYRLFRELDEEGTKIAKAHRHLFEAGMKRERRTPGEPGHEATP